MTTEQIVTLVFDELDARGADLSSIGIGCESMREIVERIESESTQGATEEQR